MKLLSREFGIGFRSILSNQMLRSVPEVNTCLSELSSQTACQSAPSVRILNYFGRAFRLTLRLGDVGSGTK